MAFQALRSSGYTLPWIDKRRQIEVDIDQARENLARTWEWRKNALSEREVSDGFISSEWQRAQFEFQQEVADINQRIFNYNLEVPSEQFQRRKIDCDSGIKRITSGG